MRPFTGRALPDKLAPPKGAASGRRMMADRIGDILRRHVDQGAAAGVVAMVTDRNGVVWQGAAGRRDVSDPAPMTVDSVCMLHSMTKAITSVGAMRLVEEGRLALDAPIAELLPVLGEMRVLDGFDGDTPRLRPARTVMTLRHLLTHTSGLGYDNWNADLVRAAAALGANLRPTGWDDMARIPLLFDPGTRWNYGLSTDMVGQAIQAVTGQDLQSYLRAAVWEKLGMADTAYTLTPAMAARRARMHQREGDAGLRPIDIPGATTLGFMGGGGGLAGTAADYATFLRMLLRGGELGGVRLLRPETVAEMGRNQIGEVVVETMRTTFPARSNDANFFPGMAQKWGLGFLINTETTPSGRSPGSLAWAGLGNSYYWIDTTRGVAGVLLAQLFPFADARMLDLLWEFERAVYAMVD